MSEMQKFREMRRMEAEKARRERAEASKSSDSDRDRMQQRREMKAARQGRRDAPQPTHGDEGLSEKEKWKQQRKAMEEQEKLDALKPKEEAVEEIPVEEEVHPEWPLFETSMLPKAFEGMDHDLAEKWSKAMSDYLSIDNGWGGRKVKPEIPLSVVVKGDWQANTKNADGATCSWSIPFNVSFIRLKKFGWDRDRISVFSLSASTDTYLGVPKEIPPICGSIGVGDCYDLECNIPPEMIEAQHWPSDESSTKSTEILPKSEPGINEADKKKWCNAILEYFRQSPGWGKRDSKPEKPVYCAISGKWMCASTTLFQLNVSSWRMDSSVVFLREKKSGWDRDSAIRVRVWVHTTSPTKDIPPIGECSVGNMEEIDYEKVLTALH